jgi:hypothetical protein
LPEAALVSLFATAGFEVELLHRERNARTGNAAAEVVTLRALKPPD